jgi:hypothetical protein
MRHLVGGIDLLLILVLDSRILGLGRLYRANAKQEKDSKSLDSHRHPHPG